MKFLLEILAVLLTAFLIGGCSSDSDGNSATSVTGNFVDDPVAGLIYSCSSGAEGITDVDGAYTCDNGDTVTFSIGDVVIGTVNAEAAIVTPYSLFPNNQDAALNLARLLQSIDSDPNDDIITLNETLVALLDVATDFVSPSFVADVEAALSITLVSVQEAQTQLNETIAIAGGDIPDGANIPVANAGVDQNVITGATVNLNGSGSADADAGDVLTYSWTMISSPSPTTITNATSVDPTFTASDDGTYEIQLVVNDGGIDSASDTVIIMAATANSAPVADAGADQAVDTDSLVTLDGSGSTDTDLDSLTYLWTVTSGSATLSSTTVQSPTFTPASDGDYVISLVVNDGTVDSDNTDSVTVTATTASPPLVYGTVTSYAGQVWHDRNLGATQVCASMTDTACYGDYYQWGRDADGHQVLTSMETPTQATNVTTVGHSDFITVASSPYDWGFDADQNGATRKANWSSTAGNSVCPVGFRLPTKQELQNEINAHILNNFDAWNNPLKLPSAGGRYADSGDMYGQGSFGYLWSSDVDDLGTGFYVYTPSMYYDNSTAEVTNDVSRAGGIAVRCIQN
ncbi:MAG: PKD domain-containing protein [Nanoarchaeota archaeon]|nr:PKD domain-containing protein [Nanoarchaeota archaeon]